MVLPERTQPGPVHPLHGLPLPNPFGPQLQRIGTTAESRRLLGHVLPLGHLAFLPGEAHHPRHQGLSPKIGDLSAHAAILAPMQLTVPAPQGVLSVLLLCAGSLQVEQADRRLVCMGQGLLVVSDQPWQCRSGVWSSVILRLDQQRLGRVALVMAEERELNPSWRSQLQPGLLWCPETADTSTPLPTSLGQVLAMAAELRPYSETLVGRLELDLLIYRLLAALLIPELRGTDPIERLRNRQRGDGGAFEALLAYILAHLHEPLSLELLEKQSHYSRRALQYAFQERFGCSPTQWIRSMRLERARQDLQRPLPGDNVTRIAHRHGYRSLNLFSIDFQQRFHVKPSDLLRASGESGSDFSPPPSAPPINGV
jgi:AraC-like DNA-binding protein